MFFFALQKLHQRVTRHDVRPTRHDSKPLTTNRQRYALVLLFSPCCSPVPAPLFSCFHTCSHLHSYFIQQQEEVRKPRSMSEPLQYIPPHAAERARSITGVCARVWVCVSHSHTHTLSLTFFFCLCFTHLPVNAFFLSPLHLTSPLCADSDPKPSSRGYENVVLGSGKSGTLQSQSGKDKDSVRHTADDRFGFHDEIVGRGLHMAYI